MNIWPFSEIRKLQESLAMANETNVQAVKNFDNLHKQAKQAESQCNSYYHQAVSDRRHLERKDELLIVKSAEIAGLTVKLAETQHLVRAADESHMNTVAELEKKTQQFEQALDRIADMVKADDGQAWKEAEKFLAQHRSTKNCVKCGSKMIELRGEDKKLCSNGACGHEVDWPLEEGQTYMYKNNVEPFIEDRSHVKEELEPAPSTRERL